MKRVLKVALFADVMQENLDGVTKTLHRMIKGVDPSKIQFLLITSLAPEHPEELPCEVISIPKINVPIYKDYPICLPWFAPGLTSKLEAFAPDIVHFSTPFTLGRFAMRYARKRMIPLLSTYHTHFINYTDYYLSNTERLAGILRHSLAYYNQRIYNRCDKVLVPTSSLEDELLYMGIDDHRLEVWGRGIDADKFKPNRPKEEVMTKWNLRADAFKLLFVSRLVWEKDLQTLIDLYQQHYSNDSATQMTIVGDGPALDEMRKQMPNAVFTGKITGEELANVYSASDAFIFPSLSETFGNVVLEAMSSGLPVVAARRGGPRGLVQEGSSGYLVEPKNLGQFHEKIEFLRNNREICRQFGQKGRAFALEQTWPSLCKQIENIYLSLGPLPQDSLVA